MLHTKIIFKKPLAPKLKKFGYVHMGGPSERKISDLIAQGTRVEETRYGSAKMGALFPLVSGITMGLIHSMV